MDPIVADEEYRLFNTALSEPSAAGDSMTCQEAPSYDVTLMLFNIMAVRMKGEDGVLPPPPLWSAKIESYTTFFQKNSMFKMFLFTNSMFPPPLPLENFALPWKKSADAHV